MTKDKVHAIIKTLKGGHPQTIKEIMIMCYDYNMEIQAMADYYADKMEMAGEGYSMTDEEMEAMAEEFGEN